MCKETTQARAVKKALLRTLTVRVGPTHGLRPMMALQNALASKRILQMRHNFKPWATMQMHAALPPTQTGRAECTCGLPLTVELQNALANHRMRLVLRNSIRK